MAARLIHPVSALLVVLLAAVTLAAFAVTVVPPASAVSNQDYFFTSSIGPTYAPGHSFGANGPYGVAVDSAGNVYTTLPKGIARFSANGTWICDYTGDGDTYTMGTSYGLDVDSGGTVYVAECDTSRIAMLRYSSTYHSLSLIGLYGDGTWGTGNGQLRGPEDVAVDGDYLYVADTGNNRIQKFSIDTYDYTLTWVATWGKNGGDGTAGSGPGEFNWPTGIAADHAGHVFVADWGNHRIEELTTGGTLTTAWGVSTPTSDPLYLAAPSGIDVDAQGSVFVTDNDASMSCVNKYGLGQGGYAWQASRFGGWGTADNQLEYPWGVAVAPNGYVYVADHWNHKLKKFGRDTTPPVVSISGVPTGWTNANANVVLSATDATVDGQYTSGLYFIFCSLTGGSPWFGHSSPCSIAIENEGDTPLNYFAYDNVYNSSTPTTAHILIDKSAPVTTVSGIPVGWSGAAVTAGFSPSDTLSGVKSTEYSTNGGVTWTTGSSATINSQGATTLLYRSTDIAGNVETTKSVTVRIDTTAPAGSFTLNGGAATTTTPNVAVGSAVSDANGVSGMRFSTDGKATWSSWASYSASATLTLPAGNGAKTVWGQYEDPAGNVFESSAAITLAAPAPSPTPSPTPISAATLKLQLSGLKGGALKFGKSVTAGGSVTPASLAGSSVTLTAQLKKGTKWVKAKTASAPIGSTGAYSWKYKPSKKGAYRMQATLAASATHGAVASKWLAFKVK